MINLFIAVFSQAIIFLPLAIALYISFCVLRATDLTLDGSFVLGAGIFAHLLQLGYSPIFSCISALLAGAAAGIGVSAIQRGQKINSLLAGVLATFILTSGNLIVMGQPNISLLNKTTLLSTAFQHAKLYSIGLSAIYSIALFALACLLMKSKIGLTLRAFGDNQTLLKRMGKSIENYRMFGFACTNCLAAASGCLTAQTVGYADIGMGLGVTLTALGAVILGKQLFSVLIKTQRFNIATEFSACFLGVIFYFFAINSLLRLEIDPLYLKIFLGIILIIFLRSATINNTTIRSFI